MVSGRGPVEDVVTRCDFWRDRSVFVTGHTGFKGGWLAGAGPKAIWGASSKGVIFSNHMARGGVKLDLAIDVNPAKQNRYIAATGLKIVSPQEALRTLPPHYVKVDQHEL